MPVRYELRYGAYTVMGTSSPLGLDGASSLIRVDAAAPIYLFLQAKEIFATVESDGNLEIFTCDHSTLVIENYFTTAAGSRIYTQNDDDIHSYSEYRISEDIVTSQSLGPPMETTDTQANIESINVFLESAKKSQQDAKSAKHMAEQELYKELFKKDNFSRGKYDISYDQESKKYIANKVDIDFLATARSQLEEAQVNFDESNDMAPEIAFRMLDDAIESMAASNVSKMLFWADGKISYASKYLDHKGKWNAASHSFSPINHLQSGIHYDSNHNITENPVPLFSALEILNARENKINAALDFEKIHGNAAELVFHLGNSAFESMKTGIFTNDQKSFISEIQSNNDMDAAQILEKINSIFPDTGTPMRMHGTEFQENLNLLKIHATLKSEETFAKNAFHRVEEHTRINLSRLEIVTNAHSGIVAQKEINAQHCEAVVRICAALDQINAIELDFMRGNDDEILPSLTPALWDASLEIGAHSPSGDGTEHPAALTGLISAPDAAHLAPH